MKKAGLIGVGLLILLIWGDMLLGLLLHGVELVLETLELLTEMFLETVFSVELYRAQAVTAWLGLGLFVLLMVFVVKRLIRRVRHWKATLPAWWRETKAELR
ncbi:hypothetical protein, partial [Methylomagnum sp.]